jgi:Tfp pilus assembly PilM family ATPase
MSLGDWFRSAPPEVAVEIDRSHVAAARLDWRGGRSQVAGFAVEALPDGAVVPALAASNMPDVGVVGQAVARAIQQAAGRARRVALVVPDAVAKVSLLTLEHVPARRADLQEIVRWQMRKTAPFPIEQAVVSVSEGGASAEGGRELVVTLAREDVVQQYEQACAMAGAQAGLVDLSTFGVIDGLVAAGAAPSGDWLLVHVKAGGVTLALARGGDLIFFRTRGEDADGTLTDLIHQTAMYYEDRLKGPGFARVWLSGGAALPGGADAVRRDLHERLGTEVDVVDPRNVAARTDRIDLSPDHLDALAPLVGVLSRDRKAA